MARFGVPDHITFDRGPQFCSALWAQLSQHLGTLHHLTTAYHPQTNGMAEKSHRQLKDALQACTASADWPSHLPWVLLGLRAAPKEDSCISSAELLYRAPLVLPGQLPGVPEPPPAVFHESSRAAPSHIPARGPSTPKEPQEVLLRLQGASFVYVCSGSAKPPLSPAYRGPFAVVSRSPKFFVLDVGEGHESVSVDRLKPHAGPSIFTPAAAPRCGRPPLPVAPPTPPPGVGGSVDARQSPWLYVRNPPKGMYKMRQ